MKVAGAVLAGGPFFAEGFGSKREKRWELNSLNIALLTACELWQEQMHFAAVSEFMEARRWSKKLQLAMDGWLVALLISLAAIYALKLDMPTV